MFIGKYNKSLIITYLGVAFAKYRGVELNE